MTASKLLNRFRICENKQDSGNTIFVVTGSWYSGIIVEQSIEWNLPIAIVCQLFTVGQKSKPQYSM